MTDRKPDGQGDEPSSTPESREVREEAFWRSGAGFHYRWPRLTVYRNAGDVSHTEHPKFVLNRYPHNVIGATVVAFGRCWSVTWKSSR